MNLRMPGLRASPGPMQELRTPSVTSARARGFTLVEVAMVLVILTLLGGSLLMPLRIRIEARERTATLTQLREIDHALTGFAIIHGRLPCPSTEADPASPQYGIEDPPPCRHGIAGRLPWRSLALSATDAWGRPRTHVGDSWAGYWHYRVDPAFASGPIRADTVPAANLQVHAHDGSRITTLDSQAIALVHSTGPNRRADGRNASFSPGAPSYQAGEPTPDFDDQLVWIGRPLLIARLAQAGRL